MAQQAVEFPVQHDPMRLLEMPETGTRFLDECFDIVALDAAGCLPWEGLWLFDACSQDRSRGDSAGHDAWAQKRALQRRLAVDTRQAC